MDELLKKLLAADILTEETKTELESAFKGQLDEAIEVARASATAMVTAQINEQWIAERETLIETLDVKVTEVMEEELTELRQDIERFRDLEAEYAEKIVEAKEEMADILKADLAQLIEKMDAFFEVRLNSELQELREDFEVVKKNQFGKSVFEAFVDEFKKHYADDGSVEAKLNETELRLQDAMSALSRAEKKTAMMERTAKMEKVLKPLSGRTREVMEAILKNMDTPLLEDAYNTYIGRVLKETSLEEQTSEKETTVLAEGKTQKTEIKGAVKSGDDEDRIITERQSAKNDDGGKKTLTESEIKRLRIIAGIN